MTWRPGDELRGGATPYHDEEDALKFLHHDGGITPAQAARIADGILEAERLTGGAPRSDAPKPGPRRNLHLDHYSEDQR
ncbi:MAG TPA: hypothetical protein VFA84_05420 [Acidimicrobiales bacterium]|nr:hypothetical protein [Acidimicrobiales bacterium]